MADSDNAIDTLVRLVAASPLYHGLARELIASVGARELGKRRTLTAAVKATKSKLHQVAGAYFPRQSYTDWLALLEESAASDDPAALKIACRTIMAHHASTRERLPILDDLYAHALGHLPPLHRVLDIACGLNPLAAPWMPLAPDAEYIALDVYPALARFLNAALPFLHLRGVARVADVTTAPPTERADLALLLKALPCLEQLEKGAGARLLAALNVDRLLVTFPVHSLGGRSKGMVATYDQQMERLLSRTSWSVARFVFPTELAFLLTR